MAVITLNEEGMGYITRKARARSVSWSVAHGQVIMQTFLSLL